MAKKYAGIETLRTFLVNLRNTFSELGHKHTLSEITDYKVDTALSSTSANPVQNKVIDAEFDAIADAMGALESSIDGKASSTHIHDDRYYTETEVDQKISSVNTSITNITSGSTPVKEAEHAESADTAVTANSATSAGSAAKATQDASGNVITSTYETKADAQTKFDEAKSYTDTKTSGLTSTTVVDNKISTHNTSTSAHSDIRDLISGLTTRLNTLANSDDTTLDQMSEIVAYIKNNKSLIDGITTNKVNVADIVNNLTTNVANKPLSAAQGVAIKGLIDALQEEVDGKADAGHTHAISEVDELQTTLDSMNENLRNNTWYGTCSTAANTVEKVVSTAKGNFELETGNIVYVLFTYTSCANATLNVDGKGAKAIKIVGNNNVSTYHWAINEVVGFVYDGTYFRILDGQIASTTYYGATKLSSSTSSTATNMAATPSAVKAAYDLADSKQDPATTLAGYGITDAYTKADHSWTQIYDSGEITSQVNAFADINIKSYKKLMVVVKCVNDGTNSPSKHGGVTFTSTNGVNYQFNLWSTMFTNAAYTSGAMATFEISDGWLICPNATRILKSSNFLGTEGGVADNLNNTGSGIMRCSNELSKMMVHNTDNDSNYYFLPGSRVMVWGCQA